MVVQVVIIIKEIPEVVEQVEEVALVAVAVVYPAEQVQRGKDLEVEQVQLHMAVWHLVEVVVHKAQEETVTVKLEGSAVLEPITI